MVVIHSVPRSEAAGNGCRRLTRDFRFSVDGADFRIPRGFTWDGASIPRLFWAIYGTPFDDEHEAGGLIHDAIYSGIFGATFSREDADKIYRTVIRMNGVGWWQATKEYYAVRWFGASHFTETQKGETENMKKLTITVLALGAIAVGCKSIEFEKIEPNRTVRASYYAYGINNDLEGLEISASTNHITAKIQRVSYDMSQEHAKIVKVSLDGAAELAGKIGAAIATSGGSVAADAVNEWAKKFISAGGDPSKASISVSDGSVTCTDGSCTLVGACSDGSCNL